MRERGEERGRAEGSRHGDGGSGTKNPHQTRIRGRHRRKRSLKWATANAQGLRHKMNLLRKRALDYKPQIISVTETNGEEWLNDAVFKIDDYNMYRSDRIRKKGGGTILYVRKEVEQRVCRALSSNECESSAWCWVVEKGGKKILVGSVYRSPNSSRQNDENLLKQLLHANEIAGDNRVLLLGDFNVPGVDWADMDVRRGATWIDKRILDVVRDCFWYQHVKEDTRYMNEQSSMLDLVFTKEEGDVRNIEHLPPLGRSDHEMVIGELVTEWKSKVVHKPRRLYQKGNYDKIIEELNLVNWGEEFEGKTVHECWIIFKTKLIELVEKYIPMSTPRDYNEPWMNKSLMRYWKKKYHAWKRYTENKSNTRQQAYRKEADVFKKQARRAKRIYEKRLSKGARHNKKAFFRYVNSKLTVRPEITEMLKGNGELADNEKDICGILGRYFSSVHTAPSNEEMPVMEAMYESEIRNLIISRLDVESRLEKLKPNKSCGPDNIHPYVLQKTATAVSIPLEKIFNLSLSSGECPSDWKSANVTPIHKKGDRTEPSNYRPVSLTSQVCKVLESIVRGHILKHLADNDILSDRQHGFREGRSCLSNLLEVMECWTEILDESDGVDVAYLDFRKAFDLVSHKHLLYKMSKYGITNQILSWVTSFLSDRKQRVVIRGTSSEPFDVTSGVPQGSVLGPILFLIYINDLPLGIISPLSLFADDSKIFTRIVSDKKKRKKTQIDIKGNEVLQRDLDNIKEWADKWKMEFNVDKCKVMHIGQNNPGHTYTMGGVDLIVTAEERDLGVLVDNKLEFDKHIKEIVNKANRMVGLIRIGFACLDEEIFMNLYPVLVRPLLEYCVQVWSPYKQKYIDLIENVQRRATKLVPGLRRKTYDQRLDKLKLTRLVERRYRGDMIHAYNIMTNKGDYKRERFFQLARERGDPELHTGLKMYKKRARKSVRRNFFSQRVINPWNLEKREVVQKEKTSGFKKGFDDEEKIRRIAREGRDERLYKLLFRVDNLR